ncbi:MAG: hypothetical protein IJZ74_10070 [Clostridia bacterium]|nr:hypothetical protein [Clostridia bacterium]
MIQEFVATKGRFTLAILGTIPTKGRFSALCTAPVTTEASPAFTIFHFPATERWF